MSIFNNIKALGLKGYEVNVANGFWEGDRNKGEMIALIQSELSEAFLALDMGIMDDKLPQFTGQMTELADVVIRIADYAEGFKLPIWEYMDKVTSKAEQWYWAHGELTTADLNVVMASSEWFDQYLYMNAACSMMLEALRKPEKYGEIDGVSAETHYLAVCLWLACVYIYDNCEYEGVDRDVAQTLSSLDYLAFVMKAKIDYNATRGYKHGKTF